MKNIIVFLTTLAMCMTLAIEGFALGIMYSNETTKQALNDEADELLTSCEEDGLLNCRVDWKYRNGVIVDLSSVGEQGNQY